MESGAAVPMASATSGAFAVGRERAQAFRTAATLLATPLLATSGLDFRSDLRFLVTILGHASGSGLMGTIQALETPFASDDHRSCVPPIVRMSTIPRKQVSISARGERA